MTVNPDATTTALTSSANPTTVGQPVTFTATVTPANSVPFMSGIAQNNLAFYGTRQLGEDLDGTVTFMDGSTFLDTETVNENGVASFTTSSLPAGSLAITATYSGNAAFLASVGTATQTVNPAKPTISVSF